MPEFAGTITEPGLYPGIDEAVYHRDPVAHEWGSLSVTAAALLVPPRAAAKFDYARQHRKLPTASMKLGTVTHGLVLGTGADIAVLDFDDRRTKAYKTAEEAVLGLGLLPVLRKDYLEAKAIADAILSHPTAGALLAAATDRETSMFWVDSEFGIWQRGRMDALAMSYAMPTGVDLKSSKDASPEGFAKSVADYGYHRQDVHYRQGLAACLGCDWRDIDFVFVVVETEPPYLVATYRISDGTEPHTPDDIGLGLEQMRAARERFRDCSKSGIWPGYSEEIERLELPRYKRMQQEKDINEWFD
ncbi:MAG: PD-(D/E)XK nuclease-like domain-containing protein [Acidimicrobiales bacterium]